jgi:hypothetical protein
MFVNRVSELALLEKHYNSGHAELFGWAKQSYWRISVKGSAISFL